METGNLADLRDKQPQIFSHSLFTYYQLLQIELLNMRFH